MMTQASAFVTGAVLLLLLAACGSSSQGPAPNMPLYRPADSAIPQCAAAGKAISLPKGFPSHFPLPPGTAITSHRRGLKHEVDISGHVPARKFTSAVSYFPHHLRQLGYTVTHYEADPGQDSEGTFRGHGYTGGWNLRVIPGCAAMSFTAGAVKIHS